MFGTTTVLSLLLTTATAFPISWPRIVARDYTPTQLAQGTNFFFDSLHLETLCSPGQIACVDSNLAKCSPEGNWEITPCTGNTTCLAVPSSDNGLLVQCMLYTDAQAAIGDENVSVDQGVTQAPMNTATAVASPSATESASATPTESVSATESASESATPTDATPTDSADPNATCTDGAEEPEATETQTITVILTPNPTESGVFITSTLTGDVASQPTETTSIPEPSDGEIATETGSDGVTVPAITPTESSPAAEPTCTESPDETVTETDPTETESSPADEQPTETTSTEEAAPTDAAPSDATPSSSSEGATLTLAPGFNPAPAPPSSASAPEVIVGGTHFIPSPSPSAAPAKMMRVRRSS